MRGILALAALLTGSPSLPSFLPVPQTTGVERLELVHEPLVRDWEESQGRARLIAILSPT
ncbi:MAG: hypothetical protein ACRD3V_02140 [Vicinamibacteria bacterium]